MVERLSGRFWTSLSELVGDIEDEGLEVVESNHEYIEAVDYDEEINYMIRLTGTGRTIAIKSIEEF